jgi:photosystem II stability/assembly factor-like uncharacterized protein
MGDHISFVDGSTGFILQSGLPESQCSAAGSDLWRTTDGGLTWTDLTVTDAGGVPDPSGVHEQGCKSGISAVTASNVFISVTDNERPATVYRSSDAGRTWTQSSAFPSPSGVSATQGAGVSRSLGVHAFGAALFTVWDGSADAEFYAVYRSTDGGADWSYVSMAPELTVVGFLSAVHWIQIGAPGESRETTDSGQTWHTFDTGYSQAAPVNPDVEFGDSRTGYATVRGSIQRSEDAGVNWTRISTPGVSGGG